MLAEQWTTKKGVKEPHLGVHVQPFDIQVIVVCDGLTEFVNERLANMVCISNQVWTQSDPHSSQDAPDATRSSL